DGGNNVAGGWIDRGQRTYRTAVIRENDLVVRLVVHDAIEPRADLDLFDDGERLQIEHRDRLIAAVRREAVPGLWGDASAVDPRRVRNIAEHFARRAIDHHHVAAARHEHPARARFSRDVVGAALTLDVEFLDFERLRVPGGGDGNRESDEQNKHSNQASGHRKTSFMAGWEYGK